MNPTRRYLLLSFASTAAFLGSVYLFLGGLTAVAGGWGLAFVLCWLTWIYRREWSRAATRWGRSAPESIRLSPREIRARMTPVQVSPVGPSRASPAEHERTGS